MCVCRAGSENAPIFPREAFQRRVIVWDHSFSSYAPDISVKNALTDFVTLTFEPQNHVTSRLSQGHSLYQV